MANFNKVIIIGNLTRDVELRYTQSGTAIAKFGVAINETYFSNEVKKTKTHFIDVNAWGKTAETIEKFFQKGSSIMIEGKFDYSSWTDKATGATRSKLEVKAERFEFQDSGKGSDTRTGTAAGPTGSEIPF